MIVTGEQLAKACRDIVDNHRTLYVLGCFGAPLTPRNKDRYISSQSYNGTPEREMKIRNASTDTFGMDCVGMIKGLLWGWTGDENGVYGGATYASNGVGDINANQMIRACDNVTNDFRDIQPGEVVWLPDHIGVYVGGGLVVECTPRWKDGCQYTALFNIGSQRGYNGRSWEEHGQLPWLVYDPISKPLPNPVTPETEETEMAYTKDAFIRDIQNVTGSRVDGVAGSKTLGKTITVSKVKNNRHMVVLPIQRRLQELGYRITALDGVAGNQFDAAVKAYQKDNGLVVDGELTSGRSTWRKLLADEG